LLLEYAILVAAAYLVGSIPFGLIVGLRARGVDIRDFGSGKTGFTNSLRTIGLGPSLLVLIGDFVKGMLPVLVAARVFHSPGLEVVAATAAVLGHVWPLFAAFKGGRGVTTAFGATAAMIPAVALVLAVVALAVIYLFRYMSLMSLVGTLTGAVIFWSLVVTGRAPIAFAAWAVIAPAIILVSHRENLRRLRNGTEPKIGEGGRRRPSPGNVNP
jgi:acyl phosphate:glycerol-3-phosphate acyltransferase